MQNQKNTALQRKLEEKSEVDEKINKKFWSF